MSSLFVCIFHTRCSLQSLRGFYQQYAHGMCGVQGPAIGAKQLAEDFEWNKNKRHGVHLINVRQVQSAVR